MTIQGLQVLDKLLAEQPTNVGFVPMLHQQLPDAVSVRLHPYSLLIDFKEAISSLVIS